MRQRRVHATHPGTRTNTRFLTTKATSPRSSRKKFRWNGPTKSPSRPYRSPERRVSIQEERNMSADPRQRLVVAHSVDPAAAE
ncbi:hypothetical protein FOT40_32905, partial [Pseudomonas aeruginosa]